MIYRSLLLSIFAILITLSVHAILPPDKVANTFHKMYPHITNAGWQIDEDYYKATFNQYELEKRCFFTPLGLWVMTQTNWIGIDRVPQAVYQSFISSPYSSSEVQNVTFVEFPQWEPIIVIQIGMNNIATQYQLFYTPQGKLLKMQNITYLHNTLAPSTFLKD